MRRITVQVLNMCDGSIREVVAKVKANSDQDAVDKLFAIAKDEMAYKYLGGDGLLAPTSQSPCKAIRAHPEFAGDWYSKS